MLETRSKSPWRGQVHAATIPVQDVGGLPRSSIDYRSPGMAQVEGTAVVASVRYVRSAREEALKSVFGPLPTEERLVLEGGILASSWYPMPLFLHFMRRSSASSAPRSRR